MKRHLINLAILMVVIVAYMMVMPYVGGFIYGFVLGFNGNLDDFNIVTLYAVIYGMVALGTIITFPIVRKKA